MENLIELNDFELLAINGGESYDWGYRMGRALANTCKQFTTAVGALALLALI